MAAIMMVMGPVFLGIGVWLGMREERARHKGEVEEIARLRTRLAEHEEMARTPMRADRPVLTDDLLRLLIERMADATFPKQTRADDAPEDIPGRPAEYEPPQLLAQDWTDPFMGLERELVGGLRPGQGIPGIQLPEDDVPLEVYEDHPMANGFDPMDTPMTDFERQAGDAYAQWAAEQARDEPTFDG